MVNDITHQFYSTLQESRASKRTVAPSVTCLWRKKYLYLLEILVFQVTLNFYREILLGVQVVFTLSQSRTRTACPFSRICLALSFKCHILRGKGIFLDVARYTRLVICISFCFKTLPHSILKTPSPRDIWISCLHKANERATIECWEEIKNYWQHW